MPKLLLLAGIVGVIILFFLTVGGSKLIFKPASPTATTSSATNSSNRITPEMITSPSQAKTYQQQFYQDTNQAPPPQAAPDANFKIQLSPSSSTSWIPNLIKDAFAAGGVCSGTPTSAKVYVLDSPVSWNDSQTLAGDLGIKATIKSSASTTKQPNFVFIDSKKGGGNLTVMTNTGRWDYHKVITAASTPAAGDPTTLAKSHADTILKSANINQLLTSATTVKVTPPDADHTGSYLVNYDQLMAAGSPPIINADNIGSLAKATSPCGAVAGLAKNAATVILAPDFQVEKVVNNMRWVKQIVDVPTLLTPDQAIAEYPTEKDLPITAIISPTPAKGTTVTYPDTLKFTGSLRLVYYDVGDPEESMYIPFYLTSTDFPSIPGSKISILIPAVDRTILASAGVELATLHFDQYVPPAASAEGAGDFASGGVGYCGGAQIDYAVTCTSGTTTVCTGYGGQAVTADPADSTKATSETDPYGVCGGQGYQGSAIKGTSTGTGQTACEKFISTTFQGKKIPYFSYTDINNDAGGSALYDPSATGGTTVECSLTAAPC